MEYDIVKAMKEIYNSAAGKWLLDGLEAQYVAPSAICENVEKTYYMLGRKELIQELLAAKEDRPEIVITNTSEYIDD